MDIEQLERVGTRLAEVEEALAQEGAAADQKTFQELMAEHARLRDLDVVAKRYLRLRRDRDESKVFLDDEETDPEMREMAEQELAAAEEALPAAERAVMVAMLPPDPVDHRNVILEIRAGTGGDEAALFAGDLYRMYQRYAEIRGWKMKLLDASVTPLGGFKEIIASIEGANVYSYMRFESGGHRVQRIPVTEAGGRIHTSAATVAVLPEADAVDDIEIRTEDLRVDVYRASGAGGQHVNTTDSAVRITHLPSGVVVQSQDERSQHKNKATAMRVLRARLLENQREEAESKMSSERRSQIGSGDRSQRIRTYNFPQNRMTDHRIGLTLHSLDRIMEGDLEELIETLRDRHVSERLAEVKI